MANIVVLGAGLGGTLMAYELKSQLREGDKLTVVGQGHTYHFVPSNPWVAVDWRKRKAIEVDLAPVFAKKGIEFVTCGAKKVVPNENRVELENGTSLPYDYPRHRHGTGPRLRRDRGAGTPRAHAIDLPRGPCGKGARGVCRIRRRIRDRSLSAPCKGRLAMARHMSSRSSSTPNCGAANYATACR